MSVTKREMPWDDTGQSHNIVEHSETVVKCTRCGKMATDESKLQKTACNPDRDRGEYV